jgi:hypothetical protein
LLIKVIIVYLRDEYHRTRLNYLHHACLLLSFSVN